LKAKVEAEYEEIKEKYGSNTQVQNTDAQIALAEALAKLEKLKNLLDEAEEAVKKA